MEEMLFCIYNFGICYLHYLSIQNNTKFQYYLIFDHRLLITSLLISNYVSHPSEISKSSLNHYNRENALSDIRSLLLLTFSLSPRID